MTLFKKNMSDLPDDAARWEYARHVAAQGLEAWMTQADVDEAEQWLAAHQMFEAHLAASPGSTGMRSVVVAARSERTAFELAKQQADELGFMVVRVFPVTLD